MDLPSKLTPEELELQNKYKQLRKLKRSVDKISSCRKRHFLFPSGSNDSDSPLRVLSSTNASRQLKSHSVTLQPKRSSQTVTTGFKKPECWTRRRAEGRPLEDWPSRNKFISKMTTKPDDSPPPSPPPAVVRVYVQPRRKVTTTEEIEEFERKYLGDDYTEEELRHYKLPKHRNTRRHQDVSGKRTSGNELRSSGKLHKHRKTRRVQDNDGCQSSSINELRHSQGSSELRHSQGTSKELRHTQLSSNQSTTSNKSRHSGILPKYESTARVQDDAGQGTSGPNPGGHRVEMIESQHKTEKQHGHDDQREETSYPEEEETSYPEYIQGETSYPEYVVDPKTYEYVVYDPAKCIIQRYGDHLESDGHEVDEEEEDEFALSIVF